jgi:Escherichia/Staphylococcus phage prohead protease
MSFEYSSVYEFGVKEITDDQTGRFEGYASVFGPPADYQGDVIARGAFARTLKQSRGKVPILMGHIMARIVGFGISAEEDDKGLKVTGEFTLDSDEGKNAYATCRHAARCGHKMGLSIGYGISEGGAEVNERTGIRKLTDIELFEYSLAATPAAPRARIHTVKAAGETWTERDFEEYLREAGLSREAAKRFVLRGYGGLADQRDADAGNDRGADTAFSAELRQLRDYISLIGA